MAESKPKTLSVKLHMDVIESARIIAAIRGVSMTDLLSDLLREPLLAMEKEELHKRSAATRPSKRSPTKPPE